MNDNIAEIAHPRIISEAEWLEERKSLLEEEKALTRAYDKLNAKRRRLPMVKVEKEYTLLGADGEKTLLELFGDKIQLIVYHFMYGPQMEAACMGCTGYINALGDLSDLPKRNTNMVMVSRGDYPKLAKYREEMGWSLPWYSSANSDFNYDFGVTLDPARGPVVYNYKDSSEREWLGKITAPEEMPGTSVFFRIGDDIYHTYSTYQRGGESLCDSYRLLDITPYGRQEDFEDSPEGWPQKPTYG